MDQLAATPELCVIPGSRNRACWLRTTQTALSGHAWLEGLLGGMYQWWGARPTALISQRVGFNFEWVGYGLLLAFATVLFRRVRNVRPSERWQYLPAFALVPYGYYMLRLGVQINHDFLLIPLLSLFAVASRSHLHLYISLSCLFAIWDFTFYGFGRDYIPMVSFLSRYSLGWLTIAMTIANCLLFLQLCQLGLLALESKKPNQLQITTR